MNETCEPVLSRTSEAGIHRRGFVRAADSSERVPDLAKLRTTEELFHNLASRKYRHSATKSLDDVRHGNRLRHCSGSRNVSLRGQAGGQYHDLFSIPAIGALHADSVPHEALLSYLRILRCAGRADLVSFSRAEDTIRTNLLLQLRDPLPDGAFRRGGGNSTVRIKLQRNLATYLGYVEFAA